MSLHVIMIFMGNASTSLDVWKSSLNPAMNFGLASPFEWISTFDMEVLPFFLIDKATNKQNSEEFRFTDQAWKYKYSQY